MADAPADKARRTMLMVEIPRDELAFRIMGAMAGFSPPPGVTAAQVMGDMEKVSPEGAEVFRRQADAAVAYFHECIMAARQPS